MTREALARFPIQSFTSPAPVRKLKPLNARRTGEEWVTEGPVSGGSHAPSLEQRLRVLEDEREIRELIVRYAQRLDARDHHGYAQLFAREGRWSGRMGDATGPAAIEAMLVEGLGPAPENFRNTQNFHLLGNVVIEIEGDLRTRNAPGLCAAARGSPVAMLAAATSRSGARRTAAGG